MAPTRRFVRVMGLGRKLDNTLPNEMARLSKFEIELYRRVFAKSALTQRDDDPPSRDCPAEAHKTLDRRRTCSDCINQPCERMAERGLADNGSALAKNLRPKCGAKTRAGGKCQARIVPGKRRCRLHGGLSTGPKRRGRSAHGTG